MATGIFFQAIGKPTQATVLSLSRQIVYLLPATLLLPLALGVEGALWAGPLADALAFITTLVMLKLYYARCHLQPVDRTRQKEDTETLHRKLIVQF